MLHNKRHITQLVLSVFGGVLLSSVFSVAHASTTQSPFALSDLSISSPALTATPFSQTNTHLFEHLNERFRQNHQQAITLAQPKDKGKRTTETISLSPTPTESSLITETIIATKTEVTPTLTPTATPNTPQTNTPISMATAGGLNADVLFSMSNTHRIAIGLPVFQQDQRVCTLAQERAPEIGAEIAEGHMHSGKNSHNFPYWFTENIISMNSEAAAFDWWIHDEIHREALEGQYTYSCVACSGNSCVQEFTNFAPK